MKNPFNQYKDISFKKETHEYTYLPTKEKFISITQLVHRYCNVFDPDSVIVNKKALQNGISVEAQKALWKEELDKSNVFGTVLHQDLENYINTNKIIDNENKRLIEQFSEIKFQGQLYTETILVAPDYKLCGTCDLIELNDGSCTVYDHKSSKEIRTTAYWKPQKMLYPLDHLIDLNYYTYNLQLSTYQFILDEVLGFWPNGINLLHFDRKRDKLITYEMPYLRMEVLNMLNHYKDPVNFKKLEDKTNPVDWI